MVDPIETAKAVATIPPSFAWLFGGGAGSGLIYLAWRRLFTDHKADKREAKLDDVTQQMFTQMQGEIKRLSDRVDELSEHVARCEEKSLAYLEELIGLRAEAGRRKSDKS